MSIPMNSVCVECLFRKRLKLARELGSDRQATETAKKIMEEFVKAPEDMDSAWMGAICDKLFQETYGLDADRLKEEKDFSNRFVLERLEDIQSRIDKADDPVYAALQFAVLGNYLDFSALQGRSASTRWRKCWTGRRTSPGIRQYTGNFAGICKRAKSFCI